MARLVLVASPFVGAVSWQATAARLADAVVADYRPLEGPDWYETVAARVAAQAGGRPWIAVLHSGAGAFAPALAEIAGARLAGLVFVDAVLPYPGRTCLENAPDWLADAMRRLRQPDGALAPWNRWFPEDPLPRLLPDEAQRAAFEADLPRTPFAFLEAPSKPSSAWERQPSAYLQLSKGYAATADAAQVRGWLVRRAQRHHLAMASHPEETAALIGELAAALTCR
jgi:pimeloyl-ACP methyl ester carboxylesterase